MGAVYFSIDTQLVQCLKQILPLPVFVETGTFEGDSVIKARPFFDELYTVELSEEYYAKAVARLKEDNAIHVHQGDSVQFLQKLCPLFRDKSVFYWLDAHWCVADGTAGEKSQCPLIQELESIQQLNSQSVIAIDDARYFLCPPPRPHEISQWPDFDAVINKLHSLSQSHETIIINDVIIYYPILIRDILKKYAHEYSIDLLSILNKLRESEADRSWPLKKVDELTRLLKESEADRAARLEVINHLTQQLKAAPKEKVNISHIAVDLIPLLPGGENGGAKLLATELVRHLSQLLPGCEFVLLTSDRSHDELSFLDSPNVRRLCLDHQKIQKGSEPSAPRPPRIRLQELLAVYLPPSVLSRLKALYRRLKVYRPPLGGVLRDLGVDLLFCPFTLPFYYDPAIPVVSVIYDLQYHYYPQFFEEEEYATRERNFKEACRLADRLICISEYVRGTVLENSDLVPEKVISIPIRLFDRLQKPSEQTIFSVLQKYGLQENEFFFYPANFWSHKNHRMLFTAFGIYRSLHPDSGLHLLCTGAPDERMKALQEAAARMRMGPWIRFPGYVSEEEFSALMASCLALIFPSLYEGFGMPLLEAMALGKPVLCSNVTSLPEVGGDAVLFFDPKKPEEILSAIEQIMTNSELAARLVERGKIRTSLWGNAETMARDYVTVFKELTGDHRRFTRVLHGVYSDGWTGNRMTVKYEASPDPHFLEMTFHFPPLIPYNRISVSLSDGEGDFKVYRIKRGRSVNISHSLSAKGGLVELIFEPTFQPKKLGMNNDERWLGCLCQDCSIFFKNQRESLLEKVTA